MRSLFNEYGNTLIVVVVSVPVIAAFGYMLLVLTGGA